MVSYVRNINLFNISVLFLTIVLHQNVGAVWSSSHAAQQVRIDGLKAPAFESTA